MRKVILRRLATIVLLAFVLTLAMGAGMVLERQAFVAPPQSAETGAPDFQLITEAWNSIQRNYVDNSAKQTKPLTYGAISGMVEALGDTGHSSFLPPEIVKSERDS